MNYQLSDEELGCIIKELSSTHPNIETVTMSKDQAIALAEEVSRSRRAKTSIRNQKIDVYDLSSGTMGVWGGDDFEE